METGEVGIYKRVVLLTERMNAPAGLVVRAVFGGFAPAEAVRAANSLQIVVQLHSEVWKGLGQRWICVGAIKRTGLSILRSCHLCWGTLTRSCRLLYFDLPPRVDAQIHVLRWRVHMLIGNCIIVMSKNECARSEPETDNATEIQF